MKRLLGSAVIFVGSVGWCGAQQARPAITGIAFARMYASNPAASDAFYRMLGFAPEAPHFELKRYDVTASQWVEVVPLPDPAPEARLAAVGFTTRDAAGLEKYLTAHGVKTVEPLAHGEFAVLDPEGNKVYFVQSGSHQLTGKPAGELTSKRIIHVGFAVKSAPAEDHFYRELLGFHEYWHGGMTPDKTDWTSLQVPEGSDWLEYMLSSDPPGDAKANLRRLGILDHFSLGEDHMQTAVDLLAKNGCAASPQADNCKKTQMGKDGKVQLNIFDPDETRVEYMEFKPSGPICCSAIKGKTPSEVEEK